METGRLKGAPLSKHARQQMALLVPVLMVRIGCMRVSVCHRLVRMSMAMATFRHHLVRV